MERDAQRRAGRVVAETLLFVKQLVVDGERNTLILNDLAESFMMKAGVIPACKGYSPPFHLDAYQYGTCMSVNHEIVHGMPDMDKNLKDGDILSIDIVGFYDGWYADAAITIPVGNISVEIQELIEHTEKALYNGIKQAKLKKKTGDIGNAIQTYAQKHKLGIAKYLSGHGIGKEIHCKPNIPNIGNPNTGDVLRHNMSFCIEPMFTLGSGDSVLSDDTWSVVTADKSLSAHFEHTILINKDGKTEILTTI